MKNYIQPGELNDELMIQRNVQQEGQDENGFPLPEIIETVADLYCKVRTISTKEYISAGQQSTTLTYKFIVNRDDIPMEITADMYIMYEGDRWNIKHIHWYDDFHFELTASLHD
ncbi:phage head closure protein [Cytobacillus praedii]|uniref:phage head closure protein n=1 Tax=Cytobacillus praedii TaxID=1742358 RepID=UPI002E22E362|nr:phage head closure protein [Cytobacillus praedii]MED3552533.1 phage head closure protein [Cytobacillus praedii]